MKIKMNRQILARAVLGVLALAALPAAAATTLALGGIHSMALRADGAVLVWGGNVGEFGNGYYNDAYAPIRSRMSRDAVAVAAGSTHSLALRRDGTVWAWGGNGSGQLGVGDRLARKSPVAVANLAGVVAIAGGSGHSLALKADGTVWAWGSNGAGQLGNGSTAPVLSPQQVPGLAGVTAIAAGANQSLALRADGSVWAWGQNNAGQLGIGSYTDAWLPTRTVDLPAVAAIAAGLLHALALGRDGKVYSWGDNSYCQLGVADQFGICHAQPRPVQVPALSGARAIAAGSGHSAVLKMDGTAWSWGHNQFGQLGNDGPVGLNRTSVVPVKAQGLAGGVEIVAREATTLVRTVDGALYGIGFNGQGQVGNGLGESDGTAYQMARVPQRTLGPGGEGWLYLGSSGVLEGCGPAAGAR